MIACSVSDCINKSYTKGFCKKHYIRLLRHGDPNKLLIREQGTGSVDHGYIRIQKNGVAKREHVIIVENILGYELPMDVEIHHVDENKANNAHENLVVCPNRGYHLLLHRRQRALEASGNPNYRKCEYCKQHSSLDQIHVDKYDKSYHKECKSVANRNHYEAMKEKT
jgi:hypothetical protein